MAKAKERMQALVPVDEQPYEVPENWQWTRIINVTSHISDGSHNPPKDTGSGIPLLSATNIHDRIIDVENAARWITDEQWQEENKRTKIELGDVLLTIVATIGRVAVVEKDVKFALQRSVAVLKPKGIESKFLSFYLESPFVQEFMTTNAKGTAQKGFYLNALEQLICVLPPLPEQRRIVDRIESLFAKLDEAKEKAQAVVDGFETRKAAILHKAFTGALTEKWREKHQGNESEWVNCCLNDLAVRIFDGPFGSNLKSDDYVDHGIRVVRLENLKNLWFDDSKQSFVTEEKYKSIEKHTVYPSDLIMSTFIADETKVCQLPLYVGFAVNKADCIGIRLKDTVSTNFVKYYLASKDVYDLLTNHIHGATRPRVNTQQIKSIPIALPSLPEQREIVRILDSLLSKEQQAHDAALAVIDRIDAMKKAVLAKAFRGELGTNREEEEWTETMLNENASNMT